MEELPLLLSLGLRRSSASAGGAAAASRAGSTKPEKPPQRYGRSSASAGGTAAAIRAADFGYGWWNGCSDSAGDRSSDEGAEHARIS